MEFRRVLFRSWDRRKTVNLGNPNLLGIFRRPTPENALFALSEGRANPIVTTICFALSAAASGPLEVIRPRPAGKYVEVSSATHGRSEERRVGKGWVSTVRSRWSPYH